MLNSEYYKDEIIDEMNKSNQRAIYIILEKYLKINPDEICYKEAEIIVLNWLTSEYKEPVNKNVLNKYKTVEEK